MKKIVIILIVIIILVAVAAGCIFAWQYFSGKSANVQNSNSEIADWLVEKNNNYQFSYPKDFFNFDKYSTNNPGSSYAFSNQQNYDFSENCPDVKDALNGLLRGGGVLNESAYRPKESGVALEKINKDTDNLCVYRYENDNGGVFCQVFITFIKDGKRVVIPRLINNGCTSENIKTLDTILSTFKFIGTETVNWKTYTNDEYGFELKYPNNWQVQDISYTYNREKIVSVNVLSPVVSGNKFFLQIGVENGQPTVTHNSFIKAILSQSVEDVVMSEDSLKATMEYKLAQQIVPTFKFAKMANDGTPSIAVMAFGGETTWQAGKDYAITYATSGVGPAGTCVDAYLVNQNGNKITLKLGSYIHLTGTGSFNGVTWQNDGIKFTLDPNISPGTYRLELDARYCAETNNNFIASTVTPADFKIVK